jgi:hypothetical protein
MEYKPWPKWVESGVCRDVNGGKKMNNQDILKDFIKNNDIGDVIDVNKNISIIARDGRIYKHIPSGNL